MSTKDFLKQTALFAQCSDAELDRVIGTARQRQYDGGDTIVRQGDEGGRGFYLILSGAAEVRTGGTLLASLGPGDYFGEMALLLPDTPRTADVIAMAATTTLVMTQWDFAAIVKSHPDIATKIMLELAQRLRNTDRALAD